ncbi:zf-CCHC domain-containing protein/UBN2 domain-containing protein [Senna tora]|uniref:Zf-CCHC domain-containing protein/UBN2 domain-containing protein n=1 Tax=Senna tora TaxID=362788 RepID=A0A834TUK3_9FABA|nr:zf-CCHC domain-containing protein/UBN2 domain-containing protein [Senna tora]
MKVLEKYGEVKISHSKVLKAFGSLKLEKEALDEKIKLIEEEYLMSALITENRKLKATIDKLNYDLEQFVKGEEKLSLILGSQRSPNDKTGLGFTGGLPVLEPFRMGNVGSATGASSTLSETESRSNEFTSFVGLSEAI